MHANCDHEHTKAARAKCRAERKRLGITGDGIRRAPVNPKPRDPSTYRKAGDPWPRFLSKVERRDDGCWVWMAFCNASGYGRFKVDGSMVYAHRCSLERKLGRKLGPDEIACHTCDNPPCVNPDHLYAGSLITNRRDVNERGRAWKGTEGERQQQRHGLAPYERFMAYVDTEKTPDGCHSWTGRVDAYGYGKFGADGPDGKRRQYKATRWLMEYELGRELENTEYVRHRCDNPVCVRREHLELGTPAENSRDIVERGRNVNAAKTHCKHGHPFDAENTYIQPSTGKRQCRACRRSRPTPASA